jgi:hypothetical protein
MEILLDDPSVELEFRQILEKIKLYRNGDVSSVMKQRGIGYKLNWGVPVTDLRKIAAEHGSSHLLALKLWNRQWRESMILATMLDEPSMVSEQQMDFWTKSFDNIEIAEHASANLWYRCTPAYAKALEWCRGKKHLVRYTAVHLIGRLAMADKRSPDEMFESFFEELVPLSRDALLTAVMERTLIILGNRSESSRTMVANLLEVLKSDGSPAAMLLAAGVGEVLDM